MAKGEYLSRITPIFLKLSRITEKWNKILITLTSILLSFDLRKPEVEKREKRVRSWCHTYLFSMSLLLVLNDVNHHGNFKGKSRVARCENSKSRITLLGQITSHAANLGAINSRWKFLVPSRVTENQYHPVKPGWRNGPACYSSFQQFFFHVVEGVVEIKFQLRQRIEPSVTILNAREKRILVWLDPGGYLV